MIHLNIISIIPWALSLCLGHEVVQWFAFATGFYEKCSSFNRLCVWTSFCFVVVLHGCLWWHNLSFVSQAMALHRLHVAIFFRQNSTPNHFISLYVFNLLHLTESCSHCRQFSMSKVCWFEKSFI